MVSPVKRVRITAQLAAVALTAGVLSAISAAPAATAAPVADPTTLVKPFVGTQNFGNTFPGASAPFGMVQLSPDTGGQGGYDYLQNRIYGFSHTHLSGVGCNVEGELPVMPTTGDVTTVNPDTYRSEYTHTDEQATPGYYRVGLTKYGINAEVTATPRTGWHRYTFPATDKANVMFNTGRANQNVFDSEVHVVGDRTVEGRIHAGGFCAGKDDHTVYFSATFDRPFASFGTWTGVSGGTRVPGSRDSASTNGNGAWVTFDATGDKDVVAKVGLSYTGVEGARKNLVAETADAFDFDATRTKLHDAWAEKLGAIAIGGGTADRQSAFYTALYHSLLHPNVAGDVDGNYAGFDKQVHQATGYTPYQNLSLWDTFRPQNQLLQMLEPQVARNVALSVVAIGRDGGWLPRWALVNSETNIMTGDPVTPFLVEAWSKGLLAGYETEAYALLKKNATSLPPATSPYNGRSAVEYYNERGYIPAGLTVGKECAHKGGDNDCSHPASATLEYAAADAALALMARGLGNVADAKMFAERGQWFRNIWDASSGMFRPRTVNGTFLNPYDPVEAGHQFHEGGAYQYQWLAPQDPQGLVALMGGRAATEKRLDDFFAYGKLLADPAKTVREDWITKPYDYYGKPTYNPNNEPDLLAPYMYLWAGRPSKTATVVRAAMTLFTTTPDGMTGNDDLGTMSAWYVFSSLGLYPTMNGADFLTVSSPQFESAAVKVGAYGTQLGGTFTITAPGTSDSVRYIQTAAVNGSPLKKTYLRWKDLANGGTLAHTVAATPSNWGIGSANEPPSVNEAGYDNRVALKAQLQQTLAVVPTSVAPQTVSLPLDVLAQTPGSLKVTVAVQPPPGWTVAMTPASPIVIKSKTAPTQQTVAISVTVPAGTTAGTYPIKVTTSAPKTTTLTYDASVQVAAVGSCASTANGQCSFDLSKQYNVDGIATMEANTEGNFDSAGWAYDAALLPSAGSVTWDGIDYSIGSTAGTAPNFVAAKAQALLVPAGQYGSVRIVAASHHGPVSGSVTVSYTDGTSASVAVGVGDWCGDPSPGTSVAIATAHRIKNGSGQDGPGPKLFSIPVPLDKTKSIRSIALPNDDRILIYALTLA